MPDYRLYSLDGLGKFAEVHVITAVNDADALAQARALKLFAKCELRDRDRKVAAIDAQARTHAADSFLSWGGW